VLFLPRDEGRGEGGVPVVVVVVVASIPKKDFLPPWSSAPKSDISLVSGLVVVGTCPPPPPPPPPALCSVPVFCLGGGRRLPLVKMSFSSSSISRRRWCRLLNFRTFFNPSGASFSPSSSSSSCVSSLSLASSSLNFFVFKDVLLLARIVLAEISSLGGTIRAAQAVLEASLFFWCSYLTSDGWSTKRQKAVSVKIIWRLLCQRVVVGGKACL